MKTNNGWRKAVSFAFALALAAAPVSMNGFAAAAEDADEPAAVSEAEAPAADAATDDTAKPDADETAESTTADDTTGAVTEDASGKIVLTANVSGQGQIAATDDGSSPVFDPEHPMQSVSFNVDKGTVVNLSAKADEGYVFLAWIDAEKNEIYPGGASISVVAEEALSLTAVFDSADKVQLIADIDGEGEIAGSDDGSEPVFSEDTPFQWLSLAVKKGETAMLSARPAEGYEFIAWLYADRDEIYSMDPTISVKMDESLHLTAYFDTIEERYLIRADVKGNGNGQIAYTEDGSEPMPDPEHPAQSIACNVLAGDSLCLKAFPDEGYQFVCWMDEETSEILTEEAMLVVEAKEARNLIAVFDVDAPRYLVSAVTEGDGQVSISVDGNEPELDPERPYQSSYYNVLEGHTATIAAKAAEGWHFLRWENTKTGKTVSTKNTFDLVITEPLSLVAVFEKDGEEETPAHIAADETLKNWAIHDYDQKNGVTPAFTSISTSAEDALYKIELMDENGAVLDTYSIDPATGKGSDAAGKAVDLPQTGLSGVHTAATGIAVLLGLVGSGLVLLSRKKDED